MSKSVEAEPVIKGVHQAMIGMGEHLYLSTTYGLYKIKPTDHKNLQLVYKYEASGEHNE